MELINAQWKIDEGRTVELRIAGNGFERVHPFKHFQKKRGGRVGTRFKMSVADTKTGEAIFLGEVMLAGWHDTSHQGQTVKFWLDDEASHHPFAGFRRRTPAGIGSVFAVILVELTDDEVPVNQAAEKALVRGHKRKLLSNDAHLMVTGEQFVQYLRETVTLAGNRTWYPELAKKWVKHMLKIEHLSDLDRDPDKARMFHEVIRRPFARWNGEAG